jgi:hypothetical protein
MVTSVPPYETVSLIRNNILHQSKLKTTKITSKIQISEVCDLFATPTPIYTHGPGLKLYLTMPITNCEAERNFSKLSLIYKEKISAHHD